MKKLAAVTVIALSTLFVNVPTAMADDATVPEESAQVVTPEAAAPEEEVVVQAETAQEPAEAAIVTKTKPKDDEDPEPETVKPEICHPVAGKGELGNGWNLISPDKYSSHIDDEGNPKHEHDGRFDIPAINGTCPGEPIDDDPEFVKYEVEVCWTMDNSDGVEGTYEWPQTRSNTCTPVPDCEEVIEIQRDLYWIENQADEDYLAGLETLNSAADDASLSPHDYYSKVFTGAACPPPPPHDECPDIPGDQPEGTDCDPVVPPTDACPDIPDNQPEGTDCTPDEPPVDEPPTDTPTVEKSSPLPDTGAGNYALLGLAGLALVVAGGATLRRVTA